MINWQILIASAENGYIWVSARRRIKKDIIVITIMRIIIINGVTRVWFSADLLGYARTL